MLLDEPLSNLDPDLRVRTRRQLRQAVKAVGIAAVWVTHEQEEAFDVADRIALLNHGRLEQVGTAQALYRTPRTSFVAAFVGRASSIEGVVIAENTIRLGDDRFVGRGVQWSVEVVGEAEAGTEVEVVFRPESMRIVAEGSGSLSGQVESRHYVGDATFFTVALDLGSTVTVRGLLEQAESGDRVWIALSPEGPPPRAFPIRSEESP
ncbi:MAG: TOBE domain-containing protein [Acidobacteriota bacterium]